MSRFVDLGWGRTIGQGSLLQFSVVVHLNNGLRTGAMLGLGLGRRAVTIGPNTILYWLSVYKMHFQ